MRSWHCSPLTLAPPHSPPPPSQASPRIRCCSLGLCERLPGSSLSLSRSRSHSLSLLLSLALSLSPKRQVFEVFEAPITAVSVFSVITRVPRDISHRPVAVTSSLAGGGAILGNPLSGPWSEVTSEAPLPSPPHLPLSRPWLPLSGTEGLFIEAK